MNEELPQLIDEVSAISKEARANFGTLTPEQLNWKPAPNEWSVAQCFEHLIVSNIGFFPIIKKIARGEYKPSLKEKLPLLPAFFGTMVLKAVQPQSQRKFKAGTNFQPSSSSIGDDIISRFEQHNHEVVEHMKLTEKLNLKKVIITSPVASFATYSLFDGYRIVVAHEQRHLAQAKRMMAREPFPTAISSP